MSKGRKCFARNYLNPSLILLLSILIISEACYAQRYYRIRNRWKNNQYINAQGAAIAVGQIQPGWWSAMWEIIPVNGTNFFQIRNRWKSNQYINAQEPSIAVGPIQPGWWSTMWEIDHVQGTNFVRFRNRWKKNQYLNAQGPVLAVGPIQPGWWSAMWTLEPVGQNTAASNIRSHNNNTNNNRTNESLIQIPGTNQVYTLAQLKKEMSKGGFTFVKSSTLQPYQWTIVYPNSGNRNVSAKFGLLMSAVQVGNNISLNSVAVYGGCGALASQGLGANCDAGVYSQDLAVKFKGGQSDYNVQGPSLSACGALSANKLCANTGVTLASESFNVTDKNGNGIGIGLSAGVGAGIDGGYEDGIISGSINLKYIAGGSISFSLNVQDVGTKVMKAGKTGYVFAEHKIVGASNAILRAYGRELPNIRSTTNKVVKVVNHAGRYTVNFLNGSFNDFNRNLNRYFSQSVSDISNWVSAATRGKRPHPLKPGEGYVSVFNQAGYVTEVSASFYYNGRRYFNSERISAGFTKQFYFPAGAVSIRVKTKGIATIGKLHMNLFFNSSSGIRNCYKCWGTIFKPRWGQISCN